MIAEVERLEETRTRLEQQFAVASAKRLPAPTSIEDVIAGLERLLDGIADVLAGEDAEATRARELMRELVDRLVIEPLGTQTKQRRGSEPVQVIVTGDFDDLFKISQTKIGRVSLSGFQIGTRRGLSDGRFSFKVVVNRRAPKFSQTAEDMAVVGRMLDEAQAPLINAVLCAKRCLAAHTPTPRRVARWSYGFATSCTSFRRRSAFARCVSASRLAGFGTTCR